MRERQATRFVAETRDSNSGATDSRNVVYSYLFFRLAQIDTHTVGVKRPSETCLFANRGAVSFSCIHETSNANEKYQSLFYGEEDQTQR